MFSTATAVLLALAGASVLMHLVGMAATWRRLARDRPPAGAWLPPGMAYGAPDDALSPADADTVNTPDWTDTEAGLNTDAPAVPTFLTTDSPPVDLEASQA